MKMQNDISEHCSAERPLRAVVSRVVSAVSGGIIWLMNTYPYLTTQARYAPAVLLPADWLGAEASGAVHLWT